MWYSPQIRLIKIFIWILIVAATGEGVMRPLATQTTRFRTPGRCTVYLYYSLRPLPVLFCPVQQYARDRSNRCETGTRKRADNRRAGVLIWNGPEVQGRLAYQLHPLPASPRIIRLPDIRAVSDCLSVEPPQTLCPRLRPLPFRLLMPSVLLTDVRSTPLQPTADIPTSLRFPQTILRATIASRCSKILTCRPSLNSPPTLTGLLILLLT